MRSRDAVSTVEPAVLSVDGVSLLAIDIARAVRRPVTDIELTEPARTRIERAHVRSLAVTRPVYGRTTGVGGNRLVPLDDGTAVPGSMPLAEHALALLRSHASSSGPLRSAERVRAMLVVRLNQLAAGGSGIEPDVVDGLLEMVRSDALPPVREYGGVGTGDLTPLATAALALLQEVPTSRPLHRAVHIGITDALPLLSSNAATIGDAALAVTRLRGLARASVAVAAATFVGCAGNNEAFSRAVEDVTPFEGAQWVCRTMRRLTAGCAPAARIQDPFGLRALPQVHGPLVDTLAILADVVTRLVNAPAENPAYPVGSGADVVHHGGFHVAYLAQALDSARLALAEAAQLSLARLSMLCAPAITGLPAFLADGRPGASGVMVVEYVVAAALAELRSAATPAALHSVTLSNGVEEDASFASLAARQALDVVAPYRTVLAGELLAAVRCLRMKQFTPPALRGLLAACRGLNGDLTDRNLTDDLQRAEQALDAAADADGTFDQAGEL